ncbi:bifunctional diguanylate cyclase/phosphodiesterase [Aromatoleum buckelii]|nr:EAL domain-containing protein [Aromatoleum buckelii]MCK0511694.1 EAL domain-containing protein [Aromatoleum buckelii]
MIAALQGRLAELEETLEAIRSRSVDALVVNEEVGDSIFILSGAEDSYRVLVEEMNEGAATVALDGTILYCNGSFGEIIGLPTARIVGSPIHAYVDPRDRMVMEALLEKGAAEKSKDEIRLATARDDTIPVYASVSKACIDGIPLLCVVLTDLTEQKHTEAFLASQRLAASILEQAAEATIMCDADGRVVRANTQAYRLAGRNPLYLPFDEAFPLASSGRDRGFSLRAVRAGETVRGLEAALSNARGDAIDVLVSANRVNDGKGRSLGCAVTLMDVTEKRSAERQLQQTQAQLQASAEIAQLGFWERDLETDRMHVSVQCKQHIGYAEDELNGEFSDFIRLLHPEERQSVIDAMDQYIEAPSPARELEFRLRHKNGSDRWILCRLSLAEESGGQRKLRGVHLDITRSRRTEEELRLAARALESAGEGVMISQGGRILSVNRAFTAITGYPAEEVIGRKYDMLYAETPRPEQLEAQRAALRSTGAWQGEISARRRSGEVYLAWASLSVVADSGGRHYVAVFSDISLNRAVEERLHYLAHHDSLTGLPNRALFQERLQDMVVRAQRHNSRFAVLCIDLDHFKPINDALGHEVGDQVLQGVAQRLSCCLRKSDTVARLGGDEFMVLLDELHDVDEAGWMAQNMVELLAEPFNLAGQRLRLSASIGIACYPLDGKSADMLRRHADQAMYIAKGQGKNAYSFFSGGMSQQARERLFLTNSLRGAVERDELVLNYQPRICMQSGTVVGAEALVRWQSPEHGLILPTRFIGLAEETGMIEPIGEWVLKTACRQMAQWQARYGRPGFISVNLSPRQFNQKKLADRIAALIEETGLEPTMLELEITESMVMGDPEKAQETLSRLARLGVRVSLDDFGTGYSSLSHLRQFPLQHLKIDKSFISDLPGDADAEAVTRAILGLASSLRLGCTAEGVETPAQRDFLAQEGCEAWQGYLFSKPVLPEALAEMLWN